jgi:hypothetical protein
MSSTPAITGRLAAMAPLEVPDAYAESVALWLDILADHIAIFAEIALPGTIEPAPVFRA